MTATTFPRTAADVVAAAEAMHDAIAERSAEIEAGRRLPTDLLDALVAAGCFRALRPRSHGGLGADLQTAMRLFETLARADGSVGWTVMIGAGSWCDLAALPRPSFDALFAAGPDMITAGAFNPTGTITPVDGGYRVTGRWGFASGCEHADWFFGNCVAGVVDGMPQLRMAVFPAADVVIEDTWHVSGLAGTGSHHFHVHDLFVAADRTFVPLHDEPVLDEPIVRIPPPAMISVVIASVAVGIAQGALDEVVALAQSKVPLLAAAPLATNPVFQMDLATADTDVRAARALLDDTARYLWAAGVAGAPLTMVERARARSAGVWATDRAVSAVEAAYRLGGGSSLYTESPLQRRLRDIHALAQHFLVRRDTLVTAGAFLAGQDVPVLVF
jgi:alkylation response protein AidB-like acyl-CoA dehydrogenase